MDARDKHAARCREHYYANKDDYIQRFTKWRETNPERFKENLRRSREKRFTERWWMLINSRAHDAAKTKKYGPSDLDPEFIQELFARQHGLCYWLGIPLVTNSKPRDPRRPSLDRLNNSRGYMRDNVVLACQFANMGRSTVDATDFSEFINELKAAFKT